MAQVNVKPLADRVLVKPAEVEQKTASGIIIPDTAKEKPMTGEVIAVGCGKKDEPMTVKVGDKILWQVFGNRNQHRRQRLFDNERK